LVRQSSVAYPTFVDEVADEIKLPLNAAILESIFQKKSIWVCMFATSSG
jgi:hypothetical protein